MKPIAPGDLKNLQAYELERPDFRARVIETKRARRVALGPLVTVVFENRETVRFQIQEMIRIERIVRPEKIQEELDVYNPLLPGDGEVAATLFIEVTDPEKVQPTLDRFVAMDEPGKLSLFVGGSAHPAVFAPGQSREDRISAVHYIRFPLGDAGRRALEGGAPAELVLAHAGYEARATLSAETLQELRRDLE